MSRDSPSRIYVGKLDRDVRERDLEDLFRKYGHIRNIDMKNGFAFVVSLSLSLSLSLSPSLSLSLSLSLSPSPPPPFLSRALNLSRPRERIPSFYTPLFAPDTGDRRRPTQPARVQPAPTCSEANRRGPEAWRRRRAVLAE